MAQDQAVKVLGLRDFQRELKALGAEFPKELRKTNYQGAKFIEGEARQRASILSRAYSKAKTGIRAAAQQRKAQIRLLATRYPWIFGEEFGSIQHRQFPPWRGSGSGAGYAVYPAIRETREQFIELYGELIDRLAAKAFPN